ncbi:glycosyl hydrolase [Arthrobacter sp. NPDC056691]|uniref:glycosyl hydrolase n=1 Tax=Arthrobacter sp. NPDC056691 TaxID=3345913 RepID=UPI00366A712F
MRELRAIAEVGFGEVEIAFSPGFWADEAQREALEAVLAEAEILDVGVAMTLGAAWPLQTPNTAKGSSHAAQELQYGVTFLTNRSVGTIELPAPFDDPDSSRPSRLVAVTAARVVNRGPGPKLVTIQDWTGPRAVIENPTAPTILDSRSLVDITGEVEEGTVRWAPPHPDQEWALFAYWMRDTEQGVTSFIDRAAAVAATEYLDEHQIGESNAALLRKSGTELFEDSLELNADSLFWTPDFVQRFRDFHGYDPTPYLPVLFAHGMCRYWVPSEEPVADFDLETGVGSRIRTDYYRLLTELYISDHLLVLQKWSDQYGLRHKAQVAYGQNLEPVRSNREFVIHGGRAEAESLNSGDRIPVNRDQHSWRFALDWQRSLVGGVHQGGETRISTELGAQFMAGYSFTLGDYKQMLDKEWATGITKPFVHGFGSQEEDADWPTQNRFRHYISDSWNDRNFPEWPNWRALTDYWARGTVVLETGTPRTDIAIYREGFLTTAARGTPELELTTPERLVDAEALEEAGFTFQFLDPTGLADPGALGDGGALYPQGPQYRAVIVDERAIAAEAAEALVRAAGHGLRVVVVGTPPHQDSGFAQGKAGNERVRQAMDRLLALPSVARAQQMSDTAQALNDLGLAARVTVQGQQLLTQLRETPDGKLLLVYNTLSRPVTAQISIEGEGLLAELDLWVGSTSAIPAETSEGRTTTELKLHPLGLRVLQLSTAGTPQSTQRAQEWTELPTRDWSLKVRGHGSSDQADTYLANQGPADWREIEALQAASGIGLYSVAVEVNEGKHFAVDLGDLAGSATIRVGGREFGPALVSGTVIDLEDSLAAASHVQIELRTSLRNAVIASGLLDASYSETRATGLIGPVRFLAAAD